MSIKGQGPVGSRHVSIIRLFKMSSWTGKTLMQTLNCRFPTVNYCSFLLWGLSLNCSGKQQFRVLNHCIQEKIESVLKVFLPTADKTKRYSGDAYLRRECCDTIIKVSRKIIQHIGLKCCASGPGMLQMQCSACFAKCDDTKNVEFSRNYTEKPLG